MFVILVSHWTRKWPFLWGPRLRSLAAIKLTDVNGSFWSFGIVACGRKLRLHDLEGWCNGLLIIFFPTASFRKQPRANATSSVYIYIYMYIYPLYIYFHSVLSILARSCSWTCCQRLFTTNRWWSPVLKWLWCTVGGLVNITVQDMTTSTHHLNLHVSVQSKSHQNISWVMGSRSN